MSYGCIASMKTRPGCREDVVSLLPAGSGSDGTVSPPGAAE
ncbi:hypothetical protein AB0E06_18175 [Streptomyces sp. NPDC048109]